jgi:hypothetical protein
VLASVSDPYSLNPEYGPRYFVEYGSEYNLLLNTDPIRIRIQTKIYNDKICKKLVIRHFFDQKPSYVCFLKKPLHRMFRLFQR